VREGRGTHRVADAGGLKGRATRRFGYRRSCAEREEVQRVDGVQWTIEPMGIPRRGLLLAMRNSPAGIGCNFHPSETRMID